MSLKEVSLDPFLIAGIYRQPLIEKGSAPAGTPLEEDINIPALGNNKQRWLLLIHNPEAAYLKEDVFSMLLKLLNACKFTLDDIALVNMVHLKEVDIQTLFQKFSPVKVILFGKALNELTKGHDKNKAWEENGIYFLYADALTDMHKDPPLKVPFWDALKNLLMA